MKIQITLKDVYGATVAYPVCAAAMKFAALAGTRTLTAPKLRIIRELGYAIEVVQLGVTVGELAA